jgi:hypothetical protein
MNCPRCGSKSIRLSRMRTSDFLRLLFLVRPVRCHICLHRRYVNVFAALMLREKPRGENSGAT